MTVLNAINQFSFVGINSVDTSMCLLYDRVAYNLC